MLHGASCRITGDIQGETTKKYISSSITTLEDKDTSCYFFFTTTMCKFPGVKYRLHNTSSSSCSSTNCWLALKDEQSSSTILLSWRHCCMRWVLGHNSFYHSDIVEHLRGTCEVRNYRELWKDFAICFSKGARVNAILFLEVFVFLHEWKFRMDKQKHSLVTEFLLD